MLHDNDADDGAGRFTRLGLCTVPVTLVVSVIALWASLKLIGT
jgi:arsenical pump membrane protein